MVIKTRTDLDSDAAAALSTVAAAFGVAKEDITGRSRATNIMPARFTWYRILHNLGYKLTEVAKATGRTHGAIHSGIRTLQEQMDTQRDLHQSLSKVRLEGYEL